MPMSPSERALKHQAMLADPPAALIGRLAATENALMLVRLLLKDEAKYMRVLLDVAQDRVAFSFDQVVGYAYRQGYRRQIAVLRDL